MAKKTFMTDDDAPQEPTPKPTLREVDAAIYGDGAVAIPDSGRQVNKPVSLEVITPDPTQPRREVPVTVRRKARESKMAEWLTWYQMAERLAGHDIPLTTLLRGEGEGSETEVTGQPIVDGFLALVGLAASINRDGLANAITVTSRGMDRYQIETGERRYQAYWLLHGALGDEKFAKIPARVVDRIDVWRQAAENGSRKPLNAIGMARQLALLVMELNKGRDGISYAGFDSFEGDCDRAFYAQVANGVVHHIPKGVSERILQATGLKSRTQIAQYRALLNISDEIWMQADEEDWAEFKIRELIRPAKDVLTAVNTSSSPAPFREGHLVASNAPMRYPLSGPGQKFATYQGRRVQMDTSSVRDRVIYWSVWLLEADDTRGLRRTPRLDELSDIRDTVKPTPPNSTPVMPALSYAVISETSAGTVKAGQRRRNPQGRVFEVLTVTGNLTSCFEINTRTGVRIPGSPFTIQTARLIDMPLVVDAATPEIPSWLGVGALVIHDDDNPAYRVKGSVKSAKYDGPSLGYLVTVAGLDGKTYGPYAQNNLRPGGGDSPRGVSPESMLDEAEADESGNGDDIPRNIFQHFRTNTLYRITEDLGNGSVLTLKADVDGAAIPGTPERFRMNDLVLYQRVYSHLPQTDMLSAEAASVPGDDEDEDFGDDEDEIEDETAPATDSRQLDVYQNIYQHIRSGVLYRVKETRLNGTVDVVECDENGIEKSAYSRVVAGTDLKRYVPDATQSVDLEKLPDRQEEMLHALYTNQHIDKDFATRNALIEQQMIRNNAHHKASGGTWDLEITPSGILYLKAQGLDKRIVIQAGQAYTLRDGRYEGEWYLVEKVHPNGAINGHIVDAQGQRVHSVGFTFSAINLRLDPNYPYLTPTQADEETDSPVLIDEHGDDELPAWARWGATVVYRETGEMCDVWGSVRGREDSQDANSRMIWFLRVTARETVDVVDVPLSDFDLVNPPASAPHPSMLAKNLLSGISEEQPLIGRVYDTARYHKMNTALVTGFQMMNAKGLQKQMLDVGVEQTQIHLDALYEGTLAAEEANHQRNVAAIKRIHAEHNEVLRQYAEMQMLQEARHG